MIEPQTIPSSSHLVQVAFQAIKLGAAITLEHFEQAKSLEYKGKGNIVTEVDKLSEEIILGLIRKEFPDHNILAEESAAIEGDSQYTWVVDPIDGTMNYSTGIPWFSISIGLLKGSEPVVGMIYAPLRGELFWAEKGQGAYVNDQRIHVSERTDLSRCTIGMDLGYDDQRALRSLDIARIFRPQVQAIRMMGSAALGLAYAAAGRFDLYNHCLIYPWDIAGALCLVPEAGGFITDWEGNPPTIWSKEIVASNRFLLDTFVKTAQVR